MSKINWKVRFKNKTFVLAFITAVVAFCYQLLGLLDIVPAVSQDNLMQVIMLVVNLLVTLGIITDPTTAGVTDSKQALNYNEPKEDN
jgi:phi LC3 family holin|nr:MAG TPA: holin [Caudoviricetes sp.]